MPLKFNIETVVPGLPAGREGFYTGKIDTVFFEGMQESVYGAHLVFYVAHEGSLILAAGARVALSQDEEPGNIGWVIFYVFVEDIKYIYLCRLFMGYSS